MDNLDIILLEAWNRVSERVRRDRVSALKRSRRRFKGILTRPMREWCLVIRASDTRINPAPGGAGFELDEEVGVPESAMDDPIAWVLANGKPHVVTLTGSLIRELTKPVHIPWPGVTYHEAAKLCGRDYKTFKKWMSRGACFEIELRREFKFPEGTPRSGRIKDVVAGRKNHLPSRPVMPDGDALAFSPRGKGLKRSDVVPRLGPDAEEASRMWAHRGIGGGRPYVWTPSPIDVNNFTGRTPHAVWGTLWQGQWEKMPEDYVLEVKRAPILRPYRGKPKFSGWHFVCPGRLDERGEHSGCGRRCTYLYGPQRVWTLAKMIGETGFDMPPVEESGLAGQWFPGLGDPMKDAAMGRMSFACKTCWGVRSACMANHKGWNEFIAQISGGLLYGRDVPRPADVCPVVRKKRAYKWKKPHPCKRRANEAGVAEAV